MSQPAQPNRSLIDGISVLLAAADAAEPVGVRDLARRLGFETTRTQRLLATLAHCGLLRQDEDRRYRPGPGLPVLSAIALSRLDLLPSVVPLMDALAKDHDCTVALGTLWRDRVAYLAVANPQRSAAAAVGANRSFPIGGSAIGILLLGDQGHAYAREHGVAALWPDAKNAQAAGQADLRQKDQRRAIAVPMDHEPSLAVAASFAAETQDVQPIVDRLRAIARQAPVPQA